MERCCRGVPAALQPVQTGCNRSCVTAFALPALQEGRQSTGLRRREHHQVCCAMSRCKCDSHCTDCTVLARVARSSTIPTSIDRSSSPEQLGSLGSMRSAWRATFVGSCGWNSLTTVTFGRGNRSADTSHARVWSSPVACASNAYSLWAPWALEPKRSAPSARHVR